MADVIVDPAPVVEGPPKTIPPEGYGNGDLHIDLAAWPSKWKGFGALDLDGPTATFAESLSLADPGNVVFLPSTGIGGNDTLLFARFVDGQTFDEFLVDNPEFITKLDGVTVLEAGTSGIVGFEIDGKKLPTDIDLALDSTVDPGVDSSLDSLLL